MPNSLIAYIADFEHPARVVFWGVLFLFLFIYAATMIFYSYDESTMAESKQAYSYAVAGIVVVSVASMVVQSVRPGTSTLVSLDAVSGLESVIAYGKAAIAVALIANIVIQGFRLIFSGGEQEYVERARKRLIYSFVGIVLVLIANTVVIAVDPGRGHDLTVLTAEMAGIANFLLTLLGASIVIALIIAGILLVVSVDESLKDKAKAIIKTGIFALIVVLISFVLVNAFLSIPVA